jgi:uncharacterized membrane protein YoaK (UPF0700 family)
MPKVDIGRHVVPARPRSLPASRLHLLLMLALTFSTGMIVDAVGYLGLDRVFSGNMTGNAAVAGMAPAGGDDLPIAGPALALAGFTGALAAAVPARRSRRAGPDPTQTRQAKAREQGREHTS